MKYKLIAADFDDTLLRSDFTLSQNTLLAVKQYIAAGGVFTVATGRMYSSLVTYLDRLQVNAPVATYQGALVVDSTTDKILFKSTMSTALTARILQFLQQRQLYAQFYYQDSLYVEQRLPHTQFYERISNITAIQTHMPLDQYVLQNNIDATKILIMLPAHQGQAVTAELAQEFGGLLTVNRSKPEFIEITCSSVSKAQAVQFIASQKGIDRSQIACIGDSYNDLSMIEYAGLGVAVGNAFDDVKRAADLVIDTNDNDGVAKFLDSVRLGRELA